MATRVDTERLQMGKKCLFFLNKEKIARMKQQTDLSRKIVSQKRTSSYASVAEAI